jgi:hypothetical protein
MTPAIHQHLLEFLLEAARLPSIALRFIKIQAVKPLTADSRSPNRAKLHAPVCLQ